MVRMGAVVLAAAFGCTSVKLVQRDGCWVRQTEKLGRVNEEIGPCTPPKPDWADDRLTRVVQECVARADYRWQTRALVAWNRGEPLPERVSDEAVVQQCMSEPTRELVSENDALRRKSEEAKERLSDVAKERDALRARVEEERVKHLATEEKRVASQEKIADRLLSGQEKMAEHLVTGQARMAEYLGEAAKKSSQPAVATATANSTSDGAATTDSTAASPALAAPATVPAKARPVRRARAARAAAPDGPRVNCAPAAPVGGATAGPATAEVKPAAAPAAR